MTINEAATLTCMFIALACVLVGLALLFIGGLALMSVKCVLFGGPLFLCGLGLWFCVDHL